MFFGGVYGVAVVLEFVLRAVGMEAFTYGAFIFGLAIWFIALYVSADRR